MKWGVGGKKEVKSKKYEILFLVSPNTKHQTPNTKHQTPNTKHVMLSARLDDFVGQAVEATNRL